MREALFYKKLKTQRTQCLLCHHFCILDNNKTGYCLNKININGILYSKNYGNIITLSDDPIEKKPLYHYKPNSYIISIAQNGCNLKCPFCQNYEIAQIEYNQYKHLKVEELKNLILNKNRNSIAFTYTEPLMWYEYILDFAKIKENIDIILISNGNINKKPAKELAKFIKATNIDLKSFNENYYRNVLKGDLNNTLNTIDIFYNKDVFIEITFLLIPNNNDSIDEFNKMIDFISSISKNIPFHISRFFPHNNYNAHITPYELLIEFYKIAKEKLNYVYIGNIPDKQYNSTYCPNCNNILIERSLYNTTIVGINNNNKCKNCNTKIPLVM